MKPPQLSLCIAISLITCVVFDIAKSVVKSRLPVVWQYDQARAAIAEEEREEAAFKAYAENFWRTNIPDRIDENGRPLFSTMPFRTARMTFWNLPQFDTNSVELGFRIDGVVLFRLPPEVRLSVTNRILL